VLLQACSKVCASIAKCTTQGGHHRVGLMIQITSMYTACTSIVQAQKAMTACSSPNHELTTRSPAETRCWLGPTLPDHLMYRSLDLTQ
jgi:hypothetical protein